MKQKIAILDCSRFRVFINNLKKYIDNELYQLEMIELPYNDVSNFNIPGKYHHVILLHSVYNRRLSLTNVTDALYDKFLKRLSKNYSKDKISIVVYDIKYANVEQCIICTKLRQPSAYEYCNDKVYHTVSFNDLFTDSMYSELRYCLVNDLLNSFKI